MTNAKAIVHVNTYGCYRGGTENYIREIAEKMSDYRHYLVYACDTDNDYLRTFTGSYGVLNGAEADIRQILNDVSPRHVFIYNIGPRSMKVFFDLRASTGCSVIKSFHDYGMIYPGTGYNRITLKRTKDPIRWYSLSGCVKRDAFTRRLSFENPWLKKRLLSEVNESDAIEVHTEDMKRTLVRSGVSPDKMFWNPPWAMDPEKGRIDEPDARTILFVGNLIRGKGLYLLLKALRLVRLPYRLKVSGEGYERKSLERYAAKHGLNVEFLGRIPKKELADLYRSGLFVVLPSILEPFGFVVLEAFSCKRAVIAFNAGGPGEILKDNINGRLVKPFDIRDMARKIESFLNSPQEAIRMGRAGYESYRANYTFEHHLLRLREKLTVLER